MQQFNSLIRTVFGQSIMTEAHLKRTTVCCCTL